MTLPGYDAWKTTPPADAEVCTICGDDMLPDSCGRMRCFACEQELRDGDAENDAEYDRSFDDPEEF